MSINLKLKQSDVLQCLETPPKVHYIPATIRGDGPANVEQFFESYTDESEGKTLTNALRGFPLRGKEFNLPVGYTAVMFQETKKPLSADEDRNFSFAGAFKQFTYWNYDKIPTKNDPLEKALDWMELSRALHDPLGEEEDEGVEEKVKKEKK
uniref:Ribonuclease H2 subunit C n=1 Tax=Culex pipiens TaxID=7175 RepID=A0A8D8CZ33_CULPI